MAIPKPEHRCPEIFRSTPDAPRPAPPATAEAPTPSPAARRWRSVHKDSKTSWKAALWRGEAIRNRQVHPSAVPKLRVVGEFSERRVAARRLKPGQNPPKHGIGNARRMRDIKIQRHQLTLEASLGIVIQRAAVIPLDAVRDPPPHNVTQRVKIKVQVQGQRIIQSKVFIVNAI